MSSAHLRNLMNKICLLVILLELCEKYLIHILMYGTSLPNCQMSILQRKLLG